MRKLKDKEILELMAMFTSLLSTSASHLTFLYSSQISLVMGIVGNHRFSPKKMDKDMKAEGQAVNRKRILPGVRR